MRYLKDFILSLIDGVAYRFRGGGYISTGSDTLVRFVWALTLAFSYAYMAHHWSALSVIVTAFLSLILVPHSFAMDAGTNPQPAWVGKPNLKDRWVAAWLPQWTVAGWQAAPAWQKQSYDAVQMALSGFFRGVVVFVPLAALNACTLDFSPLALHWGGMDWSAVWAACLTLAALQSLSYQAGEHWMPQKLGKIVADGWWPEFLNGQAWVVAMGVFNAM